MVWGTVGCEDDVYANITSGVWPGCVTGSDGHVTCDLEPRPGCCYEPMHEFARVYSIFVFALCGIITPCLVCVVCFQIGAARKARTARTARPPISYRPDLPISARFARQEAPIGEERNLSETELGLTPRDISEFRPDYRLT